MQYFYDCHIEGSFDDTGRFPFALIDAAPKPNAVRMMLGGFPDTHPGWDRLHALERLCPPGFGGGMAASSGGALAASSGG